MTRDQPTISYFIGQTVRLYAQFRQDNVLADPSGEVTIMHRDPSGNETSEIYNGGAGNVTKSATGQYYLDLTLDEEGTWYWRAKSAGDLVATGERTITVLESAFDSP